MFRASLYIITCSAKNRVRLRLRRLREPRYLIGAIVGVAYFYFAFFARMRGRAAADAARSRSLARRRANPDPFGAAVVASGPALAGVAFLVLSIVAWVLPFDSGLLDFSPAETDFLFPAPVTRRQLLIHRLLRSQIGILFGSIIIAFASIGATGWMRLRVSLGMWVVFLTMKVYFTVVTLARSRLTSERGVARTFAWAPLAVLAAAFTIVSIALVRAFAGEPVTGISEGLERLGAVAISGAPRVALWPFMAIARPLFVATPERFVRALAVAIGILAVLVVWMLRTDEAFQEAAAFAASRRAEKAQARRPSLLRARATGLTLALTGRPEPAFFWKNGVQTLRLAGPALVRILVAGTAVVIAGTSALFNAMHLRGAAAAACAMAIAVAAFTAVLGPQVVRTDLRSDLSHLDVLKTWPVRAAAVIRGEMAWPGLMLTLVGWAAIAGAATFSTAAFPGVPDVTRASIAVSGITLMPALVFAQYLVQNAAAVVFPAWVPLGDQRPRGLDAMGQRIIMLVGVMAAVAVLMLPGAVIGAIIWFAFRRLVGTIVLVPAAMICSSIVAVEVLAATELLGPLYDRLDVLAVERAE
jgi:ABC-2 type transport system permease protein